MLRIYRCCTTKRHVSPAINTKQCDSNPCSLVVPFVLDMNFAIDLPVD